MDENPFYNTCGEVPVYQLRQTLNHLILEGYLKLTDDEYPVLCLTERSEEVLGGFPVLMKVAKEKPKALKEKKVRKSAADMDGELDENLFQKLRALRLEIAQKEKIPPYIVFSDKTLVHMCLLKPRTKEEMLAVSGVGEMKYSKYGEAFLEALK